MDIWIILLIVLIIVILYVFYQVSTSSGLTQPMVQLQVNTVRPSTDPTNGKVIIKNPTSKSYYYESWFYVNTAPSQPGITNDTSKNVILANRLFSRMASTGNDIALGLYQDNSTQAYTLALYSGNTSNFKGNIITSEFPMNKWVYIVVNVNNQLVEIYLNGKLLKTIYLATAVVPTSTASISLGAAGIYTGYSTRFNRVPQTIDSDKVWKKYLEGNGQYAGVLFGIVDMLNSYLFNINITKNGEIKKQFSLGVGECKTE